MEEIVENCDRNAKLHIHSVTVHGLKHTSAEFIQEYLTSILPSKTFNELIENTNQVYHRLSSLGIFKSINVLYDYVEPSQENGGVAVTLNVQEAPRIMATASTGVKGVNGYFDISGKLRNLNRRGLNLESSLSYGILDTQDLKTDFGHASFLFSCLLSRTRDYHRDSVGIFNESQKMDWSGVSLFTHGLEVKRLWSIKYFSQELLYNLSWRQIHSVQDNVPWRIRKDAGHSLKSSFGYSISFDYRNEAVLPNNGSFGKLFLELAGLGGNVRHLKSELNLQYVKSFINKMNLSTIVKTGFCLPCDQVGQNRINDRFLLGGPTTIRGFKQFGLGPRENNFVLGGDLFWALGTSIFTPMPFVKDDIFKLHFFSNAASLVSMDNRDYNQLFSQLSLPSVSCGVGLLVRFSSVRFELNYCIPLVARGLDQVAQGLQFGVGLEFL